MPYALLVVEPVGQRQQRTPEEGQAAYAAMLAYAGELQQSGKLLAVQALTSQQVATRVETRAGRTRLIDGPFAETKEMVGGFFLVDCASRDEALALAARCPAAAWASIEVRATGTCFEDTL